MKYSTKIIATTAFGLLISGYAMADNNNGSAAEGDLLYNQDSVTAVMGDSHTPGVQAHNELENDVIYGSRVLSPSKGTSHQVVADDREISSDVIYGS